MVKKRKIKIFGVGGGATNIINRMIKNGMTGAEFWVLNTDKKMLKMGHTDNRVLLGVKTSKGFGAGGDPSVGEEAANESEQDIKIALNGADVVLITTCFGGGTGTGATPVIAKFAKDMGIFTIALVTKPFSWEGRKRQAQAEQGLERLKECVDAILVVPNDKLYQEAKNHTETEPAFDTINKVLCKGIQGISESVTNSGMIGVDYTDIRNFM